MTRATYRTRWSTTDPDGSKVLAIHETYYRKDGSLRSFTEDPVPVIAEIRDGPTDIVRCQEIYEVLSMMQRACLLPILRKEDLVDVPSEHAKD